MSENVFSDLASRVETLVSTLRKVKEENAFLREMVEELEAERNDWRGKHMQTRSQIEQVLEHLKSMDTEDELE